MSTATHETTASSGDASARPNGVTVVSIAIVACAAADLVHEAVGHGIASWIADDPILSISTVAIQNATANRFVAGCGTLANLAVGVLSFPLMRRSRRFTTTTYFFWLFGAFNLFNSGYLIFSALVDSGDWSAVIAGLDPPFLWRAAVGLVGVALYALAMRATVDAMVPFVETGEVASKDLRPLVVPAYLAGGVLMTAASVFNPISPSLILTAGIGASLGLNAGFLFVPGMIASRARGRVPTSRRMPFSLGWFVVALVVGVAFVAVLGPGIRFASPR